MPAATPYDDLSTKPVTISALDLLMLLALAGQEGAKCLLLSWLSGVDCLATEAYKRGFETLKSEVNFDRYGGYEAIINDIKRASAAKLAARRPETEQ